jgi:uncharacterized membrane protein YeaQ/YmgE (transglycosylase-associated protein family)
MLKGSRREEPGTGILHVRRSLLVGFVVGLVARTMVPGADAMELILSAVPGFVGSLVGPFTWSWTGRQ